jgi:RsiW-degrading membrane proteinase PrsW (M82 family)
MNYIAIAAAPGIAICLIIFYRDIYNKEPKLNLIVSFILGGISILPAAELEKYFAGKVVDGSLAGVAIFAFLVVGLSEELCKFFFLRSYSYRQKSFDEPLDGIVYSLMVSMGFATVENILYVTRYAELGMGYQVAFQRMFLSVPAHATFGIIMGYFVGKAKFDSARSLWLMIVGVGAAVFFHGLYDFFLFINQYSLVGQNVSELLLLGGAIVSLIVALVLSRNLTKQHRNLSRLMFKDQNKTTSV